MKKVVLVTGASGFVGKWTLAPLIERGFDVHVVTSRANISFSDAIHVHQYNLLDCTTHTKLIQAIHPTHLLHAAWYTENGKFWDAVENVTWLKATIALAETFYAEGGKRLLGVGTCAEYDWNDGICEEGVTTEAPSTFYGKIKKTTFDCLQKLSQVQNKSFVWARIFYPYGEFETKTRLIPHVILHLLQKKEAACSHGQQIRDFMHVSDIGDALAALLDSELTGAINTASGAPVKIQEVVQLLGEQLTEEKLIKLGAIADALHSPPSIVANINRLKTELKWKPKLSLEEGLLRTIAWWRQGLICKS